MIYRKRSEIVRVAAAGGRERLCKACCEWLPEDQGWYRWRQHDCHWNNVCIPCEAASRRAWWQRKVESRSAMG